MVVGPRSKHESQAIASFFMICHKFARYCHPVCQDFPVQSACCQLRINNHVQFNNDSPVEKVALQAFEVVLWLAFAKGRTQDLVVRGAMVNKKPLDSLNTLPGQFVIVFFVTPSIRVTVKVDPGIAVVPKGSGNVA